VRNRYYDWKIKRYSRLSGGCAIVITTKEKTSSSRLSGGFMIVITTGKKNNIQSSVWRVRDRYYNRKKNDLVVCLGGARLLLRPEKKDTVICLAGARSLLQMEKKDTFVCLGGA
jgi:hypothetical protein